MMGYVPNDAPRPPPLRIKGATVQPPVRGMHDDPVPTLDFASLNNFSWDTLVAPDQTVPAGIVVSSVRVEKDDGAYAVERVVKNFQGLLPVLQQTLLR